MRKIRLVKPHLPGISQIEKNLSEALESGMLSNFAKFSKKLENEVANLSGAKYSLTVSNATTGLLLLLNTLPKGSEVLVPSFTFLPSVQAILWNSLVPVFVDIDEKTYTLSIDSILSKLSPRVSAILAVNAFGAVCEIEELEELCRSRELKLFFDSAHAFGAKHKNHFLGGFGDAEVFSFSTTKLLPCGEGGVITTNSEIIYKEILKRRNYGFLPGSRDCENMGLNGKLTEIAAILGIEGIKGIEAEVHKRNLIARRYVETLSILPGIRFQTINATDLSTYKDFTLLVDKEQFGLSREKLRNELSSQGIETDFYFSPAVHQMKLFTGSCSLHPDLPVTDHISNNIISLPIYYDLELDEVDCVTESIIRIYQMHSQIHTRSGVSIELSDTRTFGYDY